MEVEHSLQLRFKLRVLISSGHADPFPALSLQAELLQTVRPGHFASFRAFVMWRQTSGRLMAQVLARALQSTPGLVRSPSHPMTSLTPCTHSCNVGASHNTCPATLSSHGDAETARGRLSDALQLWADPVQEAVFAVHNQHLIAQVFCWTWFLWHVATSSCSSETWSENQTLWA